MPYRFSMVCAALLAIASLTGCGSEDPPDAASAPAAPAPATAPTTGEAGSGQVVREHLAAVEGNDVDAYLAAVADDARFDIGGREISGRNAVRDFFESELSGGRYNVLRERASTGGVTFDLEFRRAELFEELEYVYTVRGRRITGLVARYR